MTERDRLAALHRYHILDTPPDGAFDRITSLVAQLLDVPIAIVSLVDSDRIWFKSCHGLDATEVDRAPGLCASAILGDGPYVLNDAAVDPRSLANPLVAGELGLRFYAGMPLRTHDGHNLGVLTAIDVQPRTVTDSELRILSDLASVVMDQMELRLAARQVAHLHEELQRAHEALKVRAARDPLTGIHDRTAILEELETARARAVREDRPLALMIADVDRFKQINDQKGHLVGDQVLRQVVARMQSAVRESDAIGRLGGDEFLVVMYPSDLDSARCTAERVRRAVAAAPIECPEDCDEACAVTLSVGVYSARVTPDTSVRELMRRADEALYAAKRQGRDRTASAGDAAAPPAA